MRLMNGDNKIQGNSTSYQRPHPYKDCLECVYLTVDVFGLEGHEGNWSRVEYLEV